MQVGVERRSIGIDGAWLDARLTPPNDHVFDVPLVGIGIRQPAKSLLVPNHCGFTDIEKVALSLQELFLHRDSSPKGSDLGWNLCKLLNGRDGEI